MVIEYLDQVILDETHAYLRNIKRIPTPEPTVLFEYQHQGSQYELNIKTELKTLTEYQR